MSHKHTYFAEHHASKDSQFFGTAHDVLDTDEMSELRVRIKSEPQNVELLSELASKLNYQLRYRESTLIYDHVLALEPDNYEAHRNRAARLLATLRTEEAYKDYFACLAARPNSSDIVYRLGIAAYMLGRNSEAEQLFTNGATLMAEDAEMLVATLYWLALAECRTHSGKEQWRGFDFSLDVDHHYGYRDGLAVLCGLDDAEKAYTKAATNSDTLNGCITLYAIAAYFRREGHPIRAQEVMTKLISLDDFWPGFAYIAAWLEREV